MYYKLFIYHFRLQLQDDATTSSKMFNIAALDPGDYEIDVCMYVCMYVHEY